MFSDGYNEFSLEEYLKKIETDGIDLENDFGYMEEDEYDYDTGDSDLEIP